ncbi:MAG TPA: hypothetical protein PLD25_01650 [Chloroflexota bacterium]|nr:hypothetical protein [Chloroflexota bacterium]
MVEDFTLELLKVLVPIVTALIGAYATIKVAKINNPKSSRRGQSKSSKLNRTVMFVAAGVFLASLIYLVAQLRNMSLSWRSVDLGSQLTVIDSRPGTQGKVVIYSHYPVGRVQYFHVDPDDILVRAKLVCPLSSNNITHLFSPKNDSFDVLRPNYASVPINVPANCHINFEVKDDLGDQVGIALFAGYVP